MFVLNVMIRFSLQLNIEKPKWWYRIFPCQHNVALVEENFHSRFGSKTSYTMCLKCGRKAMDIEKNCKHKEDCFGRCVWCFERLSKFDCGHDWELEPDTDLHYCSICGKWEDD